jgi:predicted glycogen debranching enzyme
VQDPLIADLTQAADQFIVRRGGDLHTVIAGYHWFSDWGRDTMIALPGLTLVTGRFDIARDILLAFSRAADQGMLPNRFPDAGETPEYNTVDASLWYFEAIRKYLEYTSDRHFVREHLYSTMKSIIDWHLAGTRFGIRCGEDGLISAGDANTQLTWMDAKIGDYVATPRHGKPVEIQALWYNALRFTESLAARFADAAEAARLGGIAAKCHESFNARFWNEDAGCFYDVLHDGTSDASMRPNQVIALSLGFTMPEPDRARRALAVIERDLLTPFGLRTLAPSDPQYRPTCDGSAYQRDSSYHQGTVWPWLMGPFITAYVRTHGDEGRAKASTWLAGFADHLRDAGLGSISEIFDAGPPHEPRGCIAQAWSVSEILRTLVEDIRL